MSNKLPFDASELAVVLSTRICHDLAGPISSVNNGVEFLYDTSIDAEMKRSTIDLLAMGASESQAKLQMIRIALGRIDIDSTSGVEEFIEIINEYFAHRKIIIKWNDDREVNDRIPCKERRIIASTILVISSLMVYGGVISVNIDRGGNNIEIIGENYKIKDDKSLTKILDRESGFSELTPQNVVVWMLRSCIHDAGAMISCNIDIVDNKGAVKIVTYLDS